MSMEVVSSFLFDSLKKKKHITTCLIHKGQSLEKE
jgi:hypothetical protein